MDTRAFYQEELATNLAEQAGLKKRDTRFSVLRGMLTVAVFVLIYFAIVQRLPFLWTLASLLIVVFAWILRFHIKLRSRLEHVDRKLGVIRTELNYLGHDLSALDEGSAFRNEDHPYSTDLDVFGKGSLFQRVNRAKSKGARAKLAEELQYLSWELLGEKQAAIRAMVDQPVHLLEFQTILAGLDQDDVKGKVQKWLEVEDTTPWFFARWIRLGLSLVFPIATVWVIAFGGVESIGSLIYPFLFNLLLLGAGIKHIKRQHAAVDAVHKSMAVKSRLIDAFLQWELKSPLMSELRGRFNLEQARADQEFRRLGRIIGQLDGMGNLLGAAVLNGMFLYHAHVFSQLMAWKHRYGLHVLDWLKATEEIEVWVSKAQFHFNHQDFAFPEGVSGNTFSADGIGHPFLKANKRVVNDVVFDGFKLMVLTGSNMAGKSTFLRTLGVNMILASMGLPVCAKRLSISPFQLLSSMKPQDSINDDRSYFQAEVIRLRMVLDRIQEQSPSFLLFDEILRGTNSEDKRNGTRAFLMKLCDQRVVGVIATHDVEIADISMDLPFVFRNNYFKSTFAEGQLHFDYQLRDGVCRTPNATQLLKSHGII